MYYVNTLIWYDIDRVRLPIQKSMKNLIFRANLALVYHFYETFVKVMFEFPILTSLSSIE